MPDDPYDTPVTLTQKEYEDLLDFQRMVLDLTRNEHGRHEGDADVGDVTGVSRGNPFLKEGDIIGFSIGGRWKYVVPARGKRHDVEAWRMLND